MKIAAQDDDRTMSSFFQGGEHLQEELTPEPLARQRRASAAPLRHRCRHRALRHYRRILSSQPVGRRRTWRSHPGEHHEFAFRCPPITRRTRMCWRPRSRARRLRRPQPKAKQAEDETAIPIQGKPKKPEQQGRRRKTPPKQQPVPTESRAIWRAGRIVDAARDCSRASPAARHP